MHEHLCLILIFFVIKYCFPIRKQVFVVFPHYIICTNNIFFSSKHICVQTYNKLAIS